MEELQPDKGHFFGKVTAAVTHEIRNVFAIISETTGLMEDILLMQSDSSGDLKDKFAGSLNRIQKQTERGVSLTSSLNGFAHTTETAESEVNAYEVIKRLLSITCRLSKQKGVEITLAECEDSPFINKDPVYFQMALFQCIESLVKFSPDYSSIDIAVRKLEGCVRITFTSSSPNGGEVNFSGLTEDHSFNETLKSVCDIIGAQAKVDISLPGISLML